ncbi:MAG: branched-chain amino acid ABC transporter permease [Micromonosporaceae bacterium]
MTPLVQGLFSGIALGAQFAMIGIGFVVIARVTRVVNLAQGSFAVLGAYLMSSLAAALSWPFAMLLSAVLTGLVAAIAGALVVTAKTHHEYAPVILTLGLAIASEGIFILIWGDLPRSYPPVSRDGLVVLGAHVLPQQLLLIAAVACLYVLLHLFFTRAYLGKALTAAALNERSAQLVGINLTAIGVVAFGVSGCIVGLSGAVFGGLVPVTPETHLGLAVAGFAAAVAGRLHSLSGTLVGGLALGVLTSWAAAFGASEYQRVVALAALVAVLFGRTLWQRRGGALA